MCTGADWRVRREEVKERRGGRGREDVMREEVRRKEGESGKVEEREKEREREWTAALLSVQAYSFFIGVW